MPYIPYLVVAGLAALVLRTRGDDSPRRRATLQIAWLLVLAAGVFITAFVSTGRGTPFGDFDKAYYPAGRAALTNLDALYDCGHADGLCFVNMPVVALVFAPLGALPLEDAHRVVSIVSLATVALMVVLLARLLEATGNARRWIVTLVLLNGPLYYSLRLANLTHVVFVLLLAALLALQSKRHWAAGALLAICALVKPPFLLWLPYLAVREPTRKAAGWFVAVLAAAGVASLVWFGAGPHRTWLAEFVAGPSTRPVGAYNAQSISGMLIRLTTSEYLVNWTGVVLSPMLRAASATLTCLVFATVAIALWRTGPPRSRADRLSEYSLVLCAMLLVSPISWTHYYLLLLLPLSALAAGTFHTGAELTRAAMCAGGLLVMLPVTLWIPPHPFFGPVVARLLLSHYVAGAGLLLISITAWRLSAPAPVADPDFDRSIDRRWNVDAF